MVHILLASLIAASALSWGLPTAAHAHGKPEHGGAFDEVQEFTFELVGKRGDANKVNFNLFIKDPSLQPVTTGDVTLILKQGRTDVTSLRLSPGPQSSFTGSAVAPDRGRYKATVLFARPGKRVLESHLTLKLL